MDARALALIELALAVRCLVPQRSGQRREQLRLALSRAVALAHDKEVPPSSKPLDAEGWVQLFLEAGGEVEALVGALSKEHWMDLED